MTTQNEQKQYTVEGTITNQNKQPVKGVMVRATDQDPNTPENPLGKPVRTNEKGKYKIIYKDEDFRIGGLESGGADIIIRVYDHNNKLLGESKMYKNSGKKAKINLTINEQTEDEILLGLNLSNAKVKDLEIFPEASRQVVNKVLNKKLENRFLEIAGKERGYLKGVLRKVKVNYQLGKELKVDEYFKKFVIPEVEKLKLSHEEVQALKELISQNANGKIEDLLELEGTFKENTALKREVRRVQTLEFSKLNGLKAKSKEALLKANLDWSDVNEATLLPLISDGFITENEKDNLIITSELSRLTGDNLPLIKSLKTSKLRSLDDLVSMNHEDWVKIIEDNKVQIPGAEDSKETYAENLRKNIEATYPTKYFLERVVKSKYSKEYQLLKTVERLQANNKTIITDGTVHINNLNWKGISKRNRKKMEADLKELAAFANRYLHLGVTEIVNDPALNESKKKEQIHKRLKALKKFQENNPSIEFANTNFIDEKSFNWDGIKKEDKKPVKRQMLAYQRVQIITDDYETRKTLLDTGFDSAMAVASISEEQFMKNSGLEYEKSRTVYLKAKEQALASCHYFEAVRDALHGSFHDLEISNQPSLVNDLKEIDGFDDLFGNQDFCDCEHCRSIFSPAAYFTDLMYFIDENVSKKLFNPQRLQHPLYLKNRRPDLWNLKLTCANTTTLIPYLQFVNEVLEAYIKKAEGVSDVFKSRIKDAKIATTLPVNLPLEELRVYSSHFGQKLYEIYKTLGLSRKNQLREALKLSQEELFIIITSDAANVQNRFGNESLTNFNVQRFIQYANITREVLTEVLKTTFFSEISKVKVALKKDTSDIQKYEEVLKGLTQNRLDLIHRYLRLWKKTDWSVREFDLLLNSLKKAGLINNFGSIDANGDPSVLQLADVMLLKEELNLSAEELSAIIHLLPLTAVKDHQKSHFERLFDLEKIFGVASVDANGKKTYKTTATLLANKSQDKITPLLLAGLGIQESDLIELFKFLGIDITLDQQLNYSKVTKLYRHARVCRALKWSVEDLIIAANILFSGSEISNLAQIHDLIEFNDWLKKSPFSLSDLTFIIEGKETGTIRYESRNERIAKSVLEIQKAPKQDKKESLVAHLAQTFNLSSDQLHKEIFPNLVTIDINAAGINTALNATFTNEKPNNLNDFDALTALMKELERISLLITKSELTPEAITFLVTHKDVFGITDLKVRTLDEVKLIDVYQKLAGIGLESERELLLQDALVQYQTDGTFNNDSLALMASNWEQPLGRVASLQTTFTLPLVALEAIRSLQKLISLADTLGLEGHNLKKLTFTSYDELVVARDIALSVFTAKYSEEKERKEKLEPYLDKINTLKRDVLCDYIIAKKDTFKFSDRSDLYNFFLLDVEMSGCFRTSRLVCTISSLQLYIHRCLINLEQSDKNLNPAIEDVKVNPTWIPAEEWKWRKNYRVWEANRKVFLYPENYIDPTLRANKTHIFKELEDELLQEKITKESAESAYKKYVSQFNELTKLRFAGAYYESVPVDFNYWNMGITNASGFILLTSVFFPLESNESKFYFFARTHTDPYQYYYRTYNHYKQIWGNWIKMEVAIEAAELSALVFRGKLYVFWTEVQTKEINNISGGDATSDGAIFKVHTKYCFLKEDGKWSTPQRVYLGYLSAEEEKIYRRGINTYPTSEKIRDKKHDEAFLKFEKKIFRKPYVIKSTNPIHPFYLAYIWSQNKGIHQKNYRINSATNIWMNFQFLGIAIRIYLITPTVDFSIFNDNFSNAKKTVKGRIKHVRNNAIVANDEKDFTFHLENAAKCTVKVGDISYTLPVNSITTPNNIEACSFPLSLSRNELVGMTNEEINAMSVSITNGSYNFLKKEFDIAYIENGDTSFYVENGFKSFTKATRTITQTQSGHSVLLLGGTLVPLTTVNTDELMDILYAKGLKQFLSLQTQNITNSSGQKVDLKGAYGEYYWEMFFHIPFLIANHLNANQKFEEAKWWYERIFNPTAEEEPGNQKPSDHNWQFRAFRNLDIEKLKEILTDNAAIDAYEKDPFNPHAIARLRLNAYQKAIVMKYVDNLLDWGDYLFTQDTRESIGEATMLYVLAQDILGKRPVKLGKCETADETKLTYDKIKDRIAKGSEFLITLENSYWITKQDYKYNIKPVIASKSLMASLKNENRIQETNQLMEVASMAQQKRVSDALVIASNSGLVDNTLATTMSAGIRYGNNYERVETYERVFEVVYEAKKRKKRWTDLEKVDRKDIIEKKPGRLPLYELVKESQLVFCVPHNEDLLDYWDRVNDRLYKIRFCMNIKGIRRSLALFQPPIDPALLVRARAAGLSMEDILSMIAGAATLPPYRFEYLLEKAKQFTQSVQGFGNALLSALEKKDTEELTLLRSTHEQNILKLTKDIKRKQVKEAKAQYKAMQETLKNVENRVNYYQGLIETGLIPWERTQQISKHAAGALRTVSSIFFATGGITNLIPQLGSPFAMKWGGEELGDSTDEWGKFMNTLASILDDVAASAGLEASFQRREEEWEQQLALAQQEIKQVDQQVLAAEIRQQLAEKSLEIHEKSVEQAKELHDFYRNKFTSLGLYNFLSSNLSRIYRQAYNIAADMARMAERAYQFEINDNTFYIAGDNWESDKAGLLAGDRLMLQLQQMEQAFIKGNVRKQEIAQTFSLAMLSPSELLTLRQTGSCNFNIPEIAFELLYPGQYRRLMKSVRVTIPGVTGPYTNVSARLTLLKGEIEKEDGVPLEEHLIAKNTSISLSGGLNDTGTFELNLRDERYLPFEGGGAISEWKIELPSKVRSFNYDTISDVLLTIGYTALEGNRTAAENALATTLTNYATTNGLLRLISLRHEFPNAYHQLLSPDDGDPQFVEFDIEKNHFPYLLQEKNLTLTQTKVYLKPASENTIIPPNPFKVNDTNITWTTGDDIAHSASTGSKNKLKGGTIGLTGSPIKKWSIDAGLSGLDRSKLDDILVLMKYRIN
ncbi:neuraminidase-like domain-containing protein [Ascidiimonas sp. W6]|uniref:Tc toxin subunit A-related protein n=1 Tax=Ascidiimonas meishanensis TaxID=3128903 RepID=UPI0030EF6A41